METRARIETAPPPLPVIDRTLQLGPDDLLPCEAELESVIVVGMPSVVLPLPRTRLGAFVELWSRAWSVVLACWARAVPVLRSIVGPVLRAAGRGMLSLVARSRALLAATIQAAMARRSPRPTGIRLRDGSPVRLRGVLARDEALLQQVQRRLASSAPAGMLLGHVDGRVVLVMDLDPAQLDAATLEEMPHTISEPSRLETCSAER